MPLIDLRDLIQFPSNGDNATDTIINGVHFNTTALNLYNYSWYDNGTISNSSRCYLIFDQYQPHMFANGSWVNATSCYMPYYGIATRGKLSVAFAACFAVTIMFTLINLRKHGRMFLREDKRFRIVGRRWQWYWMLFVAACGLISTITGIDVDRDYLQSLPIVLQSLFYYLMLPGILAAVWEATRHWGSWQERQIVDQDPFLLPQDDRRAKAEFYMPLVFYLFAWLNFFMSIPRSWTAIEKQRSPSQQSSVAKPSATDNRFKASAILAACAWLTIVYCLHHNLRHYKPRGYNIWNGITAFCHHCPTKIFFAIIVSAIRVGYAIAAAWEWDLSIMKFNGDPTWPFALGYGTTLLILVIFEIAGYAEENEDRKLIQQRVERGRAADAELGIVKKPNWWSKHYKDAYLAPEQRLRNMTAEVGGGAATGKNIRANVELGNMPLAQRANLLSQPTPRDDPFRDPSPQAGARLTHLESDGRSNSTSTTSTGSRTLGENAQSQVVRSMLDV